MCHRSGLPPLSLLTSSSPESELCSRSSHFSSPAPELSAQFIVFKLFLAANPTLNFSFFLYLCVHSRACWVSLIVTSAILYCHGELYSLTRLYALHSYVLRCTYGKRRGRPILAILNGLCHTILYTYTMIYDHLYPDLKIVKVLEIHPFRLAKASGTCLMHAV